MITADRFVLRLRAGKTEIAILPLNEGILSHLGPEGQAQVREQWQAEAIRIMAQALDDPRVRAALRDKGLHLVVAP